tara:strand:- start:13548 stop:14510 length:963 start_codon:yes stop_codon:yes gene_type:complete
MTNKEKYLLFCEQERSIPIFSQAWWLNTVAGDVWDVCLLENGEGVLATMPYVMSSGSYGFVYLSHPRLTPVLGPWLKPAKGKYSKMLSQQKDWLQALIEQLPKYDYFNQNWHYSQTNWLPLYWKNFEQTTKYTYVLEDLSDNNKLWNDLDSSLRTQIRKAEKAGLVVRNDLPIEDFIALNEMTFLRQGMKMPDSESFIKMFAEKAQERNQCMWFIAKDDKDQNHAGVLIVWDEQSAYYLMGGGNPDLRTSGAASLCMWEAIKFASTVSEKFDFEGSMLESVERFFRGFGAVQKQYFSVTHKPSKTLNIIQDVRKIFRHLF